MLKPQTKPEEFPCRLVVKDESYTIFSEEHYNYLNEKANKLYQVMFGYISQPDLDYFCSSHPQESRCFITALIMDQWINEHDFNEHDE